MNQDKLFAIVIFTLFLIIGMMAFTRPELLEPSFKPGMASER